MLDEKDMKKIAKPTREDPQQALFDIELEWQKNWWGMPEFTMGDARPQRQINVLFSTLDDAREFAKKLDVQITSQTDSIWYPQRERLKGEYEYDGNKVGSKYPICIPSKGRADCQTTGKVLDRMGVDYKFFVEKTEGDEYIKYLGNDKVVVMPFHDLGQGSIPARNFIWEWAKEKGFKRHWTVDDNIRGFNRMNNNRRLRVRGGGFFRAMEDYIDRYENIVIAGPHNLGFADDAQPDIAPYCLNSRVYSCILLDTSLPHRWRGRYNEDTDLSIRLLKEGYCSLLFLSFLMDKDVTVGVRNAKPMKGGNTENVYNTGDYRLAFAKSLQEQHPDCVEVVWKFNRWHHQVDYKKFRKNRPILKPDIVPTAINNEYGMELVRTSRYKDESDDNSLPDETLTSEEATDDNEFDNLDEGIEDGN